MFVAIAAVVYTMFAEMHRDSILSHLTKKAPGELGADFWIRILGFGVVPIFTNTAEFLNRVIVAAKRQGLGAEGRMVKYYDETKYSGQVGRFLKRSTYSYQSEYRIILAGNCRNPVLVPDAGQSGPVRESQLFSGCSFWFPGGNTNSDDRQDGVESCGRFLRTSTRGESPRSCG